MGLIFTVGTPSDVFFGDFAVQVEQVLAKQLHYSTPSELALDPYQSEEVEWYGWAQLQQLAVTTIGKDRAPHLLSVEAWRGVYLPIPIEPVQLTIDEEDPQAWLQCASLPALVRELEQLALVGSLPADSMGLYEMFEKYYEEGADSGDDMDLQTYTQLMLSAQVATERSLPLWVVK